MTHDCVSCEVVQGTSAPETPAGRLPAELLPTLRNEVAAFVEQQLKLYHWRVLDLTMTPVEQGVEAGKATVVFDVNFKHALDYRVPDDVPVLKGKMAFVRDNQSLPPEVLARLRDDVELWRAELADYIANPQDAFERIKAVAPLSKDGSILPVGIYAEDPVGRYLPAAEYLLNVPGPDEVEARAFKEMKTLAGRREVSITAYDRLAARRNVRLHLLEGDLLKTGGRSL